MSLKLEVQTEFAAGCNQEKEEDQAGGAKLGNFPTWLYWESFCAAPGLLCCPHCLSPEQHSESSLHWKEFSWSFIKWILVKIQSGSGKKKNLHLKHWYFWYVLINTNPMFLSLLLHLMLFTCGRIECYQAGERHCPWWNICASGWFISSDGIGLLRVILSWNKWESWEQDLYICVTARKGTLKEWEALMDSLGCEIQERLEWELVGEINCDELPRSVIMSCSVVKGSEICPSNISF